MGRSVTHSVLHFSRRHMEGCPTGPIVSLGYPLLTCLRKDLGGRLGGLDTLQHTLDPTNQLSHFFKVCWNLADNFHAGSYCVICLSNLSEIKKGTCNQGLFFLQEKLGKERRNMKRRNMQEHF